MTTLGLFSAPVESNDDVNGYIVGLSNANLRGKKANWSHCIQNVVKIPPDENYVPMLLLNPLTIRRLGEPARLHNWILCPSSANAEGALWRA